MANELKELIVREMVSRYRNLNNYLVVGYQGIKALEFDQLRKDLRKKKICLEIVKNSLASIAFREVGIEGIVNLLNGPIAIVTGGGDPVVVAKEIIECAKKIPVLTLRGGFVDGSILSVDDLNQLAKLPSLSVLRSQIIISVNVPIVGVVNVFNAVLRSMATVLLAVKDKKQKSGE